MVLDAYEGTHIWESRTREAARKFAAAKMVKERLRTAEIVSIEPLSDYLKRIAREGHE